MKQVQEESFGCKPRLLLMTARLCKNASALVLLVAHIGQPAKQNGCQQLMERMCFHSGSLSNNNTPQTFPQIMLARGEIWFTLCLLITLPAMAFVFCFAGQHHISCQTRCCVHLQAALDCRLPHCGQAWQDQHSWQCCLRIKGGSLASDGKMQIYGLAVICQQPLPRLILGYPKPAFCNCLPGA
jgi:hypothetical protein